LFVREALTLFTGESHIVIQFDMGTDTTFHYKFHANGHLSGDVVAPLALDVYSASQTDDEENTLSPGNNITNVVTTFVAVNHLDPHFEHVRGAGRIIGHIERRRASVVCLRRNRVAMGNPDVAETVAARPCRKEVHRIPMRGERR
jgi:hypothetical protein